MATTSSGASFSGFSERALRFLRSLKRNNNREWFQARKEVFDQECKAPLTLLVEQVNAGLMRFAPEHVTDPRKAIFRIYRDTRFSNDKTPYKTHIAAWFKRSGIDGKSAAGFYFHIAPDEVVVAGGVYQPPADQLMAIRKFLLEHHARFRKLAGGRALKQLVAFEGQSLTRDPRGFPADHPARDLIRQKQWGWQSTLPVSVAASASLSDEILKRFQALAPVVDLLNEPFAKKKASRALLFD